MTELTDKQLYDAERSAALCFKELAPEYIACPENWEQMKAELVKRANKGKSSYDVKSYLDAFAACRDRLKLRDPAKAAARKPLTEDDIEKMSADDFKRRVVIPEFLASQKGKKK